MSAPSSLKSFQQRMAEAVMAPLTRKDSRMRRRHNGVQVDRAVAEFVKPSASLSSHERLEIYNRRYWFRLFGCFEEDFPGVQAILGRARFEDLMRRYLADHPSTSFTLRNLGSRLEAWMTRHRDWLGPRADLALDMARLEWAHVETFDEVAEPLLEDAALAALDESTVLRLQPNLRLLHLHFPVDDLLIEVRNDQGSSASSSNSAQAGRRHRSVRRVLDQPPRSSSWPSTAARTRSTTSGSNPRTTACCGRSRQDSRSARHWRPPSWAAPSPKPSGTCSCRKPSAPGGGWAGLRIDRHGAGPSHSHPFPHPKTVPSLACPWARDLFSNQTDTPSCKGSPMTFTRTSLLFLLSSTLSLALAGDIKPYTQAQFDQLAREGKPVVLAIHASWCPTCKAQKPIINELMGQAAYKNVTTLMIDFDADKPLLKSYKVGMQSTLIGFKGKQEVSRSVGDTTKAGIEDLVKKTVN